MRGANWIGTTRKFRRLQTRRSGKKGVSFNLCGRGEPGKREWTSINERAQKKRVILTHSEGEEASG